jgi:hypothetical protein
MKFNKILTFIEIIEVIHVVINCEHLLFILSNY